jgi:hypothetical protein
MVYYSDLHNQWRLEMDTRMESIPCNSSHCYLLYIRMSDMKRVLLSGQHALQTQLQTSSQHFSSLTQASLLWKQYLKYSRMVLLLNILFWISLWNNVANLIFSEVQPKQQTTKLCKEWLHLHDDEYVSQSKTRANPDSKPNK